MLMDGRESVVGQSEALAYSRPTPVDTFIRTLYVMLCYVTGTTSKDLVVRARYSPLTVL